MDKNQRRGPTRSAGIAVLAFCLALTFPSISAVTAQEAPWATFQSLDHKVAFAKSVTFHLKAEVTQPLDSVWLVYSLEGERAYNSARAEFTGDRRLTADWVWELEPGELAPGAIVHYYWAVEDDQGNRAESEESSFEYVDARFDWQVLEEGTLRVHYYRGKSTAQQVLDAGTDALQRLQANMATATTEPINVYVYASERDMTLAIPSRSESYDAATVTLGMAMSGDTLVLLGKQAELAGTVAHELSHIVVGQATDNPFSELPRWLDEGLAMYAEGELPADNARSLNRAIRDNKVLSLRSMTSYPGSADLVDLFYGEAYSIVQYLIETYGPEKMRELLTIIGQGDPVEEALPQSHQITLGDLERDWRASVGLRAVAEATAVAATVAPQQASGGAETPTEVAAGEPGSGKAGTRTIPCGSVFLLPAAAVLIQGKRHLRRAA